MKELKEAVEKLATEELIRANEKFTMFRSTHEGYAVILEEIEETEYEARHLRLNSSTLWELIKSNNDTKYAVERVKDKALLLASEAIQVAAMAQKLIDSFKVE